MSLLLFPCQCIGGRRPFLVFYINFQSHNFELYAFVLLLYKNKDFIIFYRKKDIFIGF